MFPAPEEPAATVAGITVAETVAIAAPTPPIFTFETKEVPKLVRPVPAIEIEAPEAPEVGEHKPIVGAATIENPVLPAVPLGFVTPTPPEPVVVPVATVA